jgi:mannobiose 2-epimerase
MLEALIALGQVWAAPRLIRRLDEVFEIVRDRIVMPGGHLNMFATRDFSPRDQRSSFGHELEIAYLLMEAAELLHRDDNRRTEQTARNLVDHSLRWGWDDRHGGFYDEGPPEGEATKKHKVWWVQPEGLNGLLTVARLFGDADPRYGDTFVRTWRFFRQYLVDEQHGGCFDTVAADGSPLDGRRRKATPWKTAYHVTRGLLNASSLGHAAAQGPE